MVTTRMLLFTTFASALLVDARRFTSQDLKTLAYSKDQTHDVIPEDETTTVAPAATVADDALIAKLPDDIKQKVFEVWGKNRSIEIIKMQAANIKKDTIITGYSTLFQGFMRLNKDIMMDLARIADSRPGGACTELPDSILSQVWRYNTKDIARCLEDKSEASSMIELGTASAYCTSRQDDIFGSDGFTWRFTKCAWKGAVDCHLESSGKSGCCCPAGKRWDDSKGECVTCGSDKAKAGLTSGQTCTVRCSMIPTISTTLTCDGTVKLTGSAPEGECRIMKDPAIVETDNGPVSGFLRPIMWNWDLSQYAKYAPDKELPKGIPEVNWVRTFWDIPFGKPTEMFKRPEKALPWGPDVFQSPDFYKDDFVVKHCDPDGPLTPGVEDCLTLSVYVPPNTSQAHRKPVMFYIPGSGFRMSENWNAGFYDGARFVLRQDAIVVVSNYRTALLGHWASPVLQEEDPDRSTGNYGLMDQRLAMQWIRANIANFGGDPKRVTIGGHSSGGFSTNFHLLSPHSRGLFDAAITEGSTFDSPWYFQNVDDASKFYADMGAAMGCPKEDPVAQIQCLRELPRSVFSGFIDNQTATMSARIVAKADVWAGIKAATGAAWSWAGFKGGHPSKNELGEDDIEIQAAPIFPLLPVGPCVDGSDAGLKAAPRVLMTEPGAIAPVPVLADFGENEGTLFSMMMIGGFPWYDFPSMTHGAVDGILTWAFGEEIGRQLIERDYLYPHSFASPFMRLSTAISDNVFRCSNRRFAAEASKQHEGGPPVYVAETTYAPFSEESLWSRLTDPSKGFMTVLGANHLMATSWIWGVPSSQNPDDWTETEQGISMMVNCHYAYFLHCHNPNVTKTSSCFKERIDGGAAMLRACLDPAVHLEKWRQNFFPYDASKPMKTNWDVVPTTVPWPEAEVKRCDYWDSLKASQFVLPSNICRDCRNATIAAAARAKEAALN